MAALPPTAFAALTTLQLPDEDVEDADFWRSLPSSLQELRIRCVRAINDPCLPTGLQLPALRALCILEGYSRDELTWYIYSGTLAALITAAPGLKRLGFPSD